MGLFQSAYETYEYHAALAGKNIEGQKAPLVPPYHITQKCQIEISIDIDGHFLGASAIGDDSADTIIPVTLQSLGQRSGTNPPPHPFADKLSYLCPAASQLSAAEKKKANPPKNSPHAAYLVLLSGWCGSEFAHPKARAVLSYVQAGTILSDLADYKLIELKDGKLATGKLNGTEYEKCLVRWFVKGGVNPNPCCYDEEMFQSWIAYYKKDLAAKDGSTHKFCLVKGEEGLAASFHPKGIVKAAFSAKLVSANDKENFTYRGRFTSAEEAMTISCDASQKAHSALRWLIANQGVYLNRGSGKDEKARNKDKDTPRVYICWNPQGKKLPPIHRLPFLPSDNDEKDEPVTPTDYQKRLRQTMLGYKKDLPDQADVLIAAFDAATTGRLSLTYYREMKASDFLARIERWYSECVWHHGWGEKYKEKSPSAYSIVQFAFGTQMGNDEKSDIAVGTKIANEHVQRLIKCIVESASIPADIVRALVSRTTRPQSYNKKNYEELLFIACAILRKYLNDKKQKEEWPMSLEPEKRDRSYQYGRLLAIFEKVERDTYEEGEKRETNATRFLSAFYEHPLRTADIIYRNLTPYFERLKPQIRQYYKKQIEDIFYVISELEDGDSNASLKETYLFGYFLQRRELYTKKNDAKESDSPDADPIDLEAETATNGEEEK